VPIYDYVCDACGHVVEVMHGISAQGPTTCERCGGSLKRAVSAPAIVFKGSGWAKKDARDAGRSKAPAKDTASDAGAPATGGSEGAGGTGTSDTATSSGGAAGAPATASAKAASAGTSGGSDATTT
jgi:putative FmdB family regulatory protein